ncbi:elongation factor P maturation arginine rhamnosyltransferase EarP [Fusobacterium sp. PH5-44]|uniref:elongation factor P maturation arginine rhamnosyltransferase EarP n=1 Tax=Fusobacterium sp. PH5-44 TaxID=2940518 RepID=UPI003D1BBEB6
MKRKSPAFVESKKINIDIFCKIIDNFGDIGVVYRLTKELRNAYGNKLNIRIIINKLEEFIAINPNIKDVDYQQVENFICIKEKYFEENIEFLSVSDIIIEAFGYKLPETYEKMAYEKSKLIINLEYLTGEQWAKDFHLKESIIPSKITKKIFYIPGFSPESGGLLISDKIKKKVNKNKDFYQEKYFGDIEGYKNKLKGSIFTYEKNFIPLLESLNRLDEESILLLMGNKTQESVKKVLGEFKKGFGNKYKYGKIIMKFQEFLSQEEYEEVIQTADFNFVRGEDSIVRGLISGVPFLWHIYCQKDYIHMEKLNGFLYEYTNFLNNNGYSEMSSEIGKIFVDFNYRENNSLTLGKENYRYFLKNLELIKEANEKYSNFLCEKCNLTIKLKQTIDNYLGGKL